MYPSLRGPVPLESGRRAENGGQESPTVDSRPRSQQQKWRTTGLAGGGDTVAEHSRRGWVGYYKFHYTSDTQLSRRELERKRGHETVTLYIGSESI